MQFSTDALVIKETSVGENDRLVKLMTREAGVITAYAAGVKSIKSRRLAATSLLSYSNFSLSKKGDTYRITEASPIRIFFGTGSDIVSLSLSQYFCELCAVLGPQDQQAEEFMRLILNSLHFLSEGKRDPELIKAITELRVAVLSGYTPNLVACEGCGAFEDDIMYFKVDDGQLFCENCVFGENCVTIERTVLTAMRHIVYSPFERLYSFNIPEDAVKKLSNVTEAYLRYQCEHSFTTLDFYNGIK